ncbi:CoA transferase [Clostridiaceae bacterium 35-E11]
MNSALSGIRVIDFSRVLAGPFCTMNLADMGAEVIKIERPKYGDDSRNFGPFKNKESSYYGYVNRGKKSITLDLKNPKAKEIIKDLVKQADVVVENFKPGVMEKLGFGYEVLREVNPGLVYCSISGFGQYSPYSSRPAYDIVAQAMGGMMSITGFPENPPTRVGSSLGDISAGLYAAFGIVTALLHKQKTGEGQYVDVAMMDSVFTFLESNIVRHTVGGVLPERVGSRHPISAPFDSFKAKDGLVIIAIASDHHFSKLCDIMKQPELMQDEKFCTDPNRVLNEKELKTIIEMWLGQFTVDEAIKVMMEQGIPCSPILNIEQVCKDPHIEAREMLVEVEHPAAGAIKIPGNPVKLSVTPPMVKEPAPILGEHNEAILKQFLAYDDGQIAQFKEDNVI